MSLDLKSNIPQINRDTVNVPARLSYTFGDFRLDAEHLMLYRNGQEVPLTPKQVETLLALVERHGEIVSKDALMTRLWGGAAVEEANLIQNIHVLRKVLGETPDQRPMIETFRRRGYRFNCGLASDSQPSLAADLKFEYRSAAQALFHQEVEPFVGRENELDQLKKYLHQAVNGNGQLVFIAGEPGIGKTSLVRAFQREIRNEQAGLIVSAGQCLEQHGPGEAYLPFLDAFGSLLNGPHRDSVREVLKIHAPTWCLQFPAEFGSGGVFEQLKRDTMGATKERMLREMGDVLGALAAQAPVVLILEDLHWADLSSVDLLRHLCQRLGGRRLLIIGALRPQDLELSNHRLKNCRREMLGHNLCDEIALTSLNRADLSHYLDARFPSNDFSLELSELLERKTEGHPLFATSLVDHLVERCDIVRSDGLWHLARQLSEVDIEAPENVFSIIRKKMEELDDSELRALQYASIEGEEFLSVVVAELLGIDDLDLEEQLEHIGRVHKLVYACGEKELPNGALAIRYRFSHVLYQNFLYNELATKRRITLHLQSAGLLLKFYGEQAERNAAELATHFERGRDFRRAIEYLINAGDNAGRVFSNILAEHHLSNALRLVEKLPPEEQTLRKTTLYYKRGTINQVLSRFDRAIHDFTQMRELARENSLRDIEHAALNAMGTTLFWAHRMGEMSECIDQLKRRFDRSDNQRLRLETMVITALQHQCYGELAEAKPLYDEVIRVAKSIDHRPALLGALTWRSFVHFFQSEYNDAEALLIEASELAKELHDGFRLLNCLFCLGMVQGNLGRMSDALRTFNKAINMAQRNGDHAVRAKLPNCLGWIHRELQDFEQARIYDQSGVAIAREDRITEAEAHSLLNLGNNYTVDPDQETPLAAFREAEAVFGNDDWLRWRFNIRHLAGQAGYWLSRSDLERAKTNAECLLETATRHGVRKYIAVAYKLLGEVAFTSGNFLKAEELFDLALNELSRHPAPLVAWKIYGALARLHAANGEYAKANETFSLGAEVIQYIASNIDDAALKSTFLNSPAVSAFFKEKRLT